MLFAALKSRNSASASESTATASSWVKSSACSSCSADSTGSCSASRCSSVSASFSSISSEMVSNASVCSAIVFATSRRCCRTSARGFGSQTAAINKRRVSPMTSQSCRLARSGRPAFASTADVARTVSAICCPARNGGACKRPAFSSTVVLARSCKPKWRSAKRAFSSSVRRRARSTPAAATKPARASPAATYPTSSLVSKGRTRAAAATSAASNKPASSPRGSQSRASRHRRRRSQRDNRSTSCSNSPLSLIVMTPSSSCSNQTYFVGMRRTRRTAPT